jgi:hypothetical protein
MGGRVSESRGNQSVRKAAFFMVTDMNALKPTESAVLEQPTDTRWLFVCLFVCVISKQREGPVLEQ